MAAYYRDNPNATVIVDRRHGPDRRRGRAYARMRALGDRRRTHRPGTFPPLQAS